MPICIYVIKCMRESHIIASIPTLSFQTFSFFAKMTRKHNVSMYYYLIINEAGHPYICLRTTCFLYVKSGFIFFPSFMKFLLFLSISRDSLHMKEISNFRIRMGQRRCSYLILGSKDLKTIAY